MTRRNLRFTAVLATAVLLAAAAAQATDIYKWTDDQGNVHFGDRPTGAPTEQRLDIKSSPTDATRVRERLEAERLALASRRDAAAEEATGEPTADELRAERAERAEKCREFRERLQGYVNSRRLYREDENGERIYLDPEQTAEAHALAREKVEEYCSD